MTRPNPELTRSARTSRRPKTIAGLLFPLPLSSPKIVAQLEQFRIEYEAEYGETDLTKRYTSLWPSDHQDWLLTNHPKKYFDGLPPFAKAYLKGKMELAAADGQLDDMPDSYLALFLKGQMQLPEEARDR
jgi:hypothetical protein